MMLAEYHGGPGDGQRRAVPADDRGPVAVMTVFEAVGAVLAGRAGGSGRRGSYVLVRQQCGAPLVDAAGFLVYRWGGWSSG